MTTALQRVNALPVPCWVRSDNDLLPKWLRYLKWQRETFGEDEIVGLRVRIQGLESEIDSYLDGVKRNQAVAEECRKELAELEGSAALTDEMILAKYEALLESPHVVGTRIDTNGCLVVLISPVVPGAEDRDFGLYEIDFKSYQTAEVRVPYLPRPAYRTLHYWLSMRHLSERPLLYQVTMGFSGRTTTALASYDVLPAVDDVISHLKGALDSTGIDRFEPKTEERDGLIPWTGWHVANPVQALRRLSDAVVESREEKIDSLKSQIMRTEERVKSYRASIRDFRKERRENQALLQQRLEAATVEEIDIDEAVRSLEYVTNLQGVIAIRFNEANIPVLHVRNSIVEDGRRYDLGDFELTLTTEVAGFGTVLNVKRTRVPLGGSYEAGWHPYANAFCFGNRSDEIIKAFYAGDIMHAVNAALGTMNTVSYGTRLAGQFAEIAMEAVWVNRRRRRPRRKPRAVLVAA